MDTDADILADIQGDIKLIKYELMGTNGKKGLVQRVELQERLWYMVAGGTGLVGFVLAVVRAIR